MKKKIFTFIAVLAIPLVYYFSVTALKSAENTNTTVTYTQESFPDSSTVETIAGCVAINKYSSGQRLMYEVSDGLENTGVNYGFDYKYCMPGTYTTDSGRTVLHPVPGLNYAGYLCKDIYENLQHSDLFDSKQNDKCMWYIKPVMRIKSGLPDELPVARIEVLSYNGKVMREINISTENFKDYSGNYNGDYREKYMFLYSHPEILGGSGENDLNYGLDKQSKQRQENCKVDFRVYWYGSVELWFDKMIVDDEIANQLFDPKSGQFIDYRISEEEKYFLIADSKNNFLREEISASRIPCIKHIMDRMKIFTGSSGETVAVTDILHVRGLKKDDNNYNMFFDLLHPQSLRDNKNRFYVFSDDKVYTRR